MSWIILLVSLVLSIHHSQSSECGISNLPNDAGESSGEHLAAPGNFPWHAGIYHKRQRENKHELVCGGTLISPRLVITAGYCAASVSAENMLITFGKINKNLETQEEHEVRRNVLEIKIHEKYTTSTSTPGNLALLVLDSGVPVTSFVRPACLDYNKTHEPSFDNMGSAKGYVAGWGRILGLGKVAEELKYARTSVMNFTECLNLLQTKVPSRASALAADQYCDAGNAKESVFQHGNGGAGLTFVLNGIHYVLGTQNIQFKWDTKNTDDGRPTYTGTYTKIPLYYGWIQDHAARSSA